MVIKDTLKQWFSNGKKPDEQQFWAWLESYWHKDEKIPIETIQDIQNILSGKADTELVNKLIEELKGKVDKSVVEALQKYIDGLIDDSLTEADNKTYSINKINEITKGLITEAVTDIDYNAETGILTIEYEVENPKEINLPKDNFLSEVKYKPETKDIAFTMSNGSAFTINVAELVDTYEAAPNGGLEVINSNQFQIKEKGVAETMLSQELQEKLNKTRGNTGGTLQDITTNGNITDKDLITNGAVLGRDTANENLKFGKDALKSITTGKKNTALGDGALSSNQTSPEDTAVGYNALSKLDGDGDYNTALGAYAGQAVTKSMNSTFVGTAAGNVVTTSNRDTFIGATSGYSYTGDPRDNGLPVGKMNSGSNTFIGDAAGYSMTRGFGNTFVGGKSGVYFTYGGAYNTFIGYGIASFTAHTYGSNNIVIGANAPINGSTENKLIIHSQGDKKNGGIWYGIPLIYGDFAERWIKIGGKFILRYDYTPDADATPAEGQQPFSPTKMLVADVDGNVGVQKILSPETPVTNIYSFTKNYYTAVFLHPFTDTSDTTYIQIQNASPGTIRNLTIKGRLVTAEAFLKFELTAGLTPTGFNFCTYKTLRNQDLFTSIGLIYYDKGAVMLCITGDIWHKDILLDTNIIIDQIQAFENSTLNWKDDALVEVKESTIDKTLIKASIVAEGTVGGNPY